MLPEILKKERTNKGLSQANLATILGVSQQAIGSWEVGRTSPDPEMLKKIANYFNVSTDHLLGNDSLKTDSVKLTKKDLGNLDKLLQQAEVTFDSDTYKLTDDDRTKIRSALELAFFDAKKRNKRKKD
ncbi:helix-turn-helix domain-containing protein [Pectinatus frisingensis]|uniref:helix-turn-helix domain-containing protein n=1 Tax=Pectinatus frisingensis TaxID=865 RepID=UPI0018C6DD6F|nr:helix-turn-helix domain-containing protein [Pectinatus frisingensis]